MDFDDFVATIEKLQERIKVSRHHIGQYEIRTRVSLIDPMLCALGWEVGEPKLVRIEGPVQVRTDGSEDTGGRPDYALLGRSGNPVVLVEAKKLAVPVSNKARSQVVAYVTDLNMDNPTRCLLCACTNGDSWQLYDIQESRIVLDTSLSRDRSEDCAFKLLGLWQRSLSDGSLRAAVQRVRPSPQSSNVEAQQEQRTTSTSDRGAGLPPSGWDRLAPDFTIPEGKKPVSLWLPSGEVKVRAWRDVIIRTASWLLQQGDLTSRLPIYMGKGDSSTRYLLNVEPKHPGGEAFRSPKELLGGSAYLEANLARREIVQLTQKLLRRCGIEPNAVGIKF